MTRRRASGSSFVPSEADAPTQAKTTVTVLRRSWTVAASAA